MTMTASPFRLKDTDLLLGPKGSDLADASIRCQLTQSELVPSASGGGDSLETFCATFADPGGRATWELQLAGFQAYADAQDLTMLLFDHELEEFDFLLLPRGGTVSATNPGFSGTVTLTPTNIGGTAAAWATFTVTLTVKGRPVKVTSVPAP
jgi:hypothetical protein